MIFPNKFCFSTKNFKTFLINVSNLPSFFLFRNKSPNFQYHKVGEERERGKKKKTMTSRLLCYLHNWMNENDNQHTIRIQWGLMNRHWSQIKMLKKMDDFFYYMNEWTRPPHIPTNLVKDFFLKNYHSTKAC